MKANSWEGIENFYKDLNNHNWEHHKLLELVNFIKTSNLSEKLNGTTSHDKLIISPNEEIDFDKESLHIEFDRDEQKWIFKYYGGNYYKQNQPEFLRTYNQNQGIEKFLSIIKLLKW